MIMGTKVPGTALVTGASRGIGRAVAKRLAEEGIYVILGCSRISEYAEAAADEIRAGGGRAEVKAFRVEDEEAVDTAVKEIIAECGSIDILVNNAGINKDGLLVTMSGKDFEDVLSVNLYGTFYCMKAVAKNMIRKRYGRIVNISSAAGITGNAGQSNYAASKAGIIGLTKSAARELAGRNITVNAVAPGFIYTDMTGALAETVRESAAAAIPLKHFGEPEDVAEAVAFLCAEKNGYITGQVLAVDGGLSM